MKIKCPCGYFIVDNTDALPYKASLLPDQDEEALWDNLSRGLAELMHARGAGQRSEWLRTNLSDYLGRAPQDMDDELLVYYFATSLRSRYSRTLYQCGGCGRLYLDNPANRSDVVSFVPEDRDAARDVLASTQPRRK
jgi:hypothetical protein